MNLYTFTLSLFLLVGIVVADGDSNCPNVDNMETNVFKLVSDLCYEYVEELDKQVSYSEAVSGCSSRKGRLVTVPDNATQMALYEKLKDLSSSHTILLGLRRTDDKQWLWSSGKEAAFTNWQDGTACDNCDCARMLLTEEGHWEQFECAEASWYPVYVCEYGAGFSINSQDRKQQMFVAVLALISLYFVSFTGSH